MGFATLEPAFTVRLQPDVGLNVGKLSQGDTLTVFPIPSGTIKSEPGFPIDLDAEVVHGADYARMEAGQTHLQINVNAVAKNKDGSLFAYSYKGMLEITQELMPILTGSPDAKTTSYGNAVSHVRFETGAESLKPLEHSIFVGTAHFVVLGPGKFIVETKVSKVVG
ncbi:uncharacterized protein E0L32_005869 [Thyridium curvatum]|uniref:Uncharacterized protein n=1 Tax=Thyridium curvatum TaxID=1093900 RepID=A0A507B3M8_9PEZI|nr:uncharacterized protein E0L32_005869 [Thyridium curvatum]TPX13666.1 hypothetical protein E0L32_005869 [Thyridium curvatum]